jgi:hypothetical protein
MLTIETLVQFLFIKFTVREVVIRDTLARQDRPSIVDERNYQPRLQTFILGLNVVDGIFELYVCIKA